MCSEAVCKQSMTTLSFRLSVQCCLAMYMNECRVFNITDIHWAGSDPKTSPKRQKTVDKGWSVPLQVVFAKTEPKKGPIPSGRGVATHGAPLGDGDIQALLKDSCPSWRSVLSSGEVTQAYE